VQQLNAQLVISETLKDIESFFFHSSKFSIKKEYCSSSKQHASIKGSGPKARLIFSKEFCHFEVKNTDDLFEVMIIVCHEVAHYLNKHTDYKDTEAIDFTAIEAWADFFGARIFLTTITYGKKTQKQIKKFSGELEQGEILSSIGRALYSIYNYFYLTNTDHRYQPARVRVLLFTSGTSSFFYRLYGELKPKFTLYVITKILNEAGLTEIISKEHADWEKESKIGEKIRTIHKEIQGHNIAITKGIKPQYIPLLVTNYQLTEAEVSRNQKVLIEQVKATGLDFEIEDFIVKA